MKNEKTVIKKLENEELTSTTTVNEIRKINRENYELAKQIAFTEFNKFYGKTGIGRFYIIDAKESKSPYLCAKRAKEAIFNSAKYDNLNYATKCVSAATMAFGCDDEKFIKILIDKTHYTFGNICYLASFMEKLNNLAETMEDLDLNELKLVGNDMKHISRLRAIMKTIYGIDDYQLIASKIMEIAAVQKDMYTVSLEKTR